MAKNTERFSDRVENYVRYRPGYPSGVLTYLKDKIGLTSSTVIADIGSGTGISAEVFLHNGNKVYAVEPNKEMREAADHLLSGYPGYVSVNGSSEATTLPGHSIDLVVAAQAFHWFDRHAFRLECTRIGRPSAHCLLMWNERKVESDFEKAYEDLLLKFANDYLQVDHRNIKKPDIAAFFSPLAMHAEVLDNVQVFDFEGVKGRLLSSSYAPNYGEPKYEPMLACLREIFDKYQVDGKVSFSYDCNLFLGKI